MVSLSSQSTRWFSSLEDMVLGGDIIRRLLNILYDRTGRFGYPLRISFKTLYGVDCEGNLVCVNCSHGPFSLEGYLKRAK